MKNKNVSATFGIFSYSNIEKPQECPRCHRGINPEDTELYVTINRTAPTKKQILQYTFECPLCENLFFANYRHIPKKVAPILISTEPKTILPIKLDPEIQNLSSIFCEIYQQAMASDQMGFNLISGIAFRKALEFLIKDFCKKISLPEKYKEIEEERSLRNCIINYIQEPKIRAIAERAAWLGNDETHYIRIWEDKNIDDLKKLLRILLGFIATELESQKFISEMKKSKKFSK